MKHHRYKWPMAPLATSVARRRSLNPKPKCLHLQQSPENWKQTKTRDTSETEGDRGRQGDFGLKITWNDTRTVGQAWRPPWPGTESCAARFDIGIQYGWSWAPARVRAAEPEPQSQSQSNTWPIHGDPPQCSSVSFGSFFVCFALLFTCFFIANFSALCCICFFYSFF